MHWLFPGSILHEQSQLRVRLLDHLREQDGTLLQNKDKNRKPSVTERLLGSLFLDYLNSYGYAFTQSVFLPESRMVSWPPYSNQEILQLLHLDSSSTFSPRLKFVSLRETRRNSQNLRSENFWTSWCYEDERLIATGPTSCWHPSKQYSSCSFEKFALWRITNTNWRLLPGSWWKRMFSAAVGHGAPKVLVPYQDEWCFHTNSRSWYFFILYFQSKINNPVELSSTVKGIT